MILQPLGKLAGSYLLLALASSCVCQERGSSSQQDLQLLCENKSDLTLSRASQIRSLVEEYRTSPIPCPTSIVAALRDLNKLIDDNKNNVCRLEAVNRIRIYYQNHVAPLAAREQHKPDNSVELPVALKNLFLGYGLQVSRACKLNMIPTLMYNRNYLKQVGDPVELEAPLKEKLDEYQELLAGILKVGGSIDNLVKIPAEHDDLLLPRDVEQLVQQQDSRSSEKLFVQAKSLHALRVFQAICERRYRSVYRQLIMPVLYLSNMGFNYRGEELKHELDEMQVNEKIHLYYRVTFFCEAIDSLELVEDLADVGKNQKMESTQIVRILSAEEAKDIQRRNEQVRSGDSGGKYEETNKLIDSIGRFVFEPDYNIQIGDEILDSSNSNLMELVNSFSTNQSELDRIRSKFIRKFKQAIKNTLKDRLRILFGKEAPGGRSAFALPDDFGNSKLMELIDEQLDETYNPDKPVAGWLNDPKGSAKRQYYRAAMTLREDYRPAIAKGFLQKVFGSRLQQMLGFFIFIVAVIVAIAMLSVSG